MIAPRPSGSPAHFQFGQGLLVSSFPRAAQRSFTQTIVYVPTSHSMQFVLRDAGRQTNGHLH